MFEDLQENLDKINKTNRFYRDQHCKRVLENGVGLFYVNGKHDEMIREKKRARQAFFVSIGCFILCPAFIGIIGYLTIHLIRKIW